MGGVVTGAISNVHANLTVNGGYTFCHKSGKVVTFRLLATCNTAGTLGTYTKVCELPFSSIKQVWGPVDYGNLGGYSRSNYYSQNKNVNMAAPITLTVGQEVTITGTYMTND